jgi:hypothetical protein
MKEAATIHNNGNRAMAAPNSNALYSNSIAHSRLIWWTKADRFDGEPTLTIEDMVPAPNSLAAYTKKPRDKFLG